MIFQIQQELIKVIFYLNQVDNNKIVNYVIRYSKI
jgi:hypothetical protein